MKIENSVALVTGGNRGIGEAFVRAFAGAGARRVYAACRSKGDAAHLVKESPDCVVELTLDVTDAKSIARAARECTDVSILVNCILGMANWFPRWYRPTGWADPGYIADAMTNLVVAGMGRGRLREG